MDLIIELLNNGWSVSVSNKKNKKYDVYHDDKYILSFGNINYQHYKDQFKYYKSLDHNDEKRLNNFRKRFNKLYQQNKTNPYSAIFWSWNILW